MRDPSNCMHTLYACTHYITPRVENDRLFRGHDPLPMLFVFRVTCCPLTLNPWPLTLVRQPADTSAELTAPKAHWPRKQRDTERKEREGAEALTADLSWRGDSVHPEGVTVYLFKEVKKQERKTQISFMKSEKQSWKHEGSDGRTEGKEEGQEVKNRMGGQTWVNPASGGHTLPEETGASRLASTLMAFTYTHTHAHAYTHMHAH